MKTRKLHFACLLFMLFLQLSLVKGQSLNEQPFTLEKSSNYSGMDIQDKEIQWGHLTVPENWKNPQGNKISLAVVIIKSRNKQARGAVVFLPGGPGGNALKGMKRWLNHPLREDKDIVLMDPRGTGFSQPQLCPDLSKSYMGILADDDDNNREVEDRVKVTLACRDELLKKHIDVSAYNSTSVAQDLHALKAALGYTSWSVYGVSYGTRMGFEYLRDFPSDIERLILDSPVLPYAGLYDNNTSNYMRSLGLLFERAGQDEQCRKEYGDISSLFYSTIDALQKDPITVQVPSNIVPGGKFTLNAQDFMVAVQQGLYDRKFIEVLPALIQQFNQRNKNLVTALVTSMKGRLNLDYGTYYCVLCNETLPVNSLSEYKSDAARYKGLVADGLPFYKGDYYICDKWGTHDSTVIADTLGAPLHLSTNVPTLILSGQFDPVTPPANGKVLEKVIPGSKAVVIPDQGHAPGSSKAGTDMIVAFLNNTIVLPVVSKQEPLSFATHIRINGGIYKLAMLLNQPVWSSWLPIVLVLVLSLVYLIVRLIIFLIRPKKSSGVLSVRLAIAITAILVLFTFIGLTNAINTVAARNFYILVLGLPERFAYLFTMPYLVVLGALVSAIVLILKRQHISGREKAFSWVAVAGFVVVSVYFFSWGLF
ncbi:alpha/beta fold hydrolase [Chitinophaga sancti]|uniref:Alpha/beta fold hydrolase n=1 Tax=Chitinophaga sancti TaxID=1004 RepID=A0A1K1QP42_9BACT|nr:alpha/beta fold hydrolase [Chitinophaga sancti]WQD65067.1 alpha/beta fold hydrolase [Chitinophaga sancti]WQG89309.1 alpha/beta fold hydrolase [Chitinophaga sancti]SFW61468.1 Pimeloyl-ACP methyl ester carboxylesterase [Chitinophaga sancti]